VTLATCNFSLRHVLPPLFDSDGGVRQHGIPQGPHPKWDQQYTFICELFSDRALLTLVDPTSTNDGEIHRKSRESWSVGLKQRVMSGVRDAKRNESTLAGYHVCVNPLVSVSA
jgi:hypothetical protein